MIISSDIPSSHLWSGSRIAYRIVRLNERVIDRNDVHIVVLDSGCLSAPPSLLIRVMDTI